MHRIEYASLKYYNNVISEECLYVGMLYNNLSTGKRDFRYISNFKRFQAFDDEADVDFVKAYLEGIRQQVENNIFNYKKSFSVSEFSKFYCNEFKFTAPVIIDVNEDEDYVDKFFRLYMKFDIKADKRLDKNEEKKYIKRILEASNASFSVPKVLGTYDETVNFDYVVGDVAIKLFSFKEKDGTRLIPSAKQWAFTTEELKGKYRVIFIYDDATDSSSMKVVMEILKKHGEVYRLDEGIERVVKAIS